MARSINWEGVGKFVSKTLPWLIFLWTAYSYIDSKNVESQVRLVEATEPFLEYQLELFKEVTALASRIATTQNGSDRDTDIRRFRELYWGEIALVEKGPVEEAMMDFKEELDRNGSAIDLRKASLALAHRAREELAASRGVTLWRKEERSWISRRLHPSKKDI